jgi:hypothetical protein
VAQWATIAKALTYGMAQLIALHPDARAEWHLGSQSYSEDSRKQSTAA